LSIVLSISLLPDSMIYYLIQFISSNVSFLSLTTLQLPISVHLLMQEAWMLLDALQELYTKFLDNAAMLNFNTMLSSQWPGFALVYEDVLTCMILFAAMMIFATDLHAIDLLIMRLAPRLSSDPNYSYRSSSWTLIRLIHSYLSPLYLGGHYGLFGTMTKTREELVIFLSKSGEAPWLPIEFAYKPGLPSQSPRAVYPLFHMPRLDWLMWFAALRPLAEDWPEWLWRLLVGILENRSETRELLHPDLNVSIFGEGSISADDHTSGSSFGYRFIRVQLFEYRFGSTIGNLQYAKGADPDTTTAIPQPQAAAATTAAPLTSIAGNDSTMGGLISPRDGLANTVHPRKPHETSFSATTSSTAAATAGGEQEDTAVTTETGDEPQQVDAMDTSKAAASVTAHVSANESYATSPATTPRASSSSSSKQPLSSAAATAARPSSPTRPRPTTAPRSARRKFWSIRFQEDLLPPMPLTHVLIYHDKIRNMRRQRSFSSSLQQQSGSTSSADEKLEMSTARAAEIIKRFTFYASNSLSLQEPGAASSSSSRPSAMSKAIREPIKRSPSTSPKISQTSLKSPSSGSEPSSPSPLMKNPRRQLARQASGGDDKALESSSSSSSSMEISLTSDPSSASLSSTSAAVLSSDASSASMDEGFTKLHLVDAKSKDEGEEDPATTVAKR
jgi:hypothetical protein